MTNTTNKFDKGRVFFGLLFFHYIFRERFAIGLLVKACYIDVL